MSPPLLSRPDLSQPENVIQARHELHRLLDLGEGDASAWTRKWGEAAIATAEGLAGFDEEGVNTRWLLRKVKIAAGDMTQITSMLAKPHPDADALKIMLRDLTSTIEDLRSYLEDGE